MPRWHTASPHSALVRHRVSHRPATQASSPHSSSLKHTRQSPSTQTSSPHSTFVVQNSSQRPSSSRVPGGHDIRHRPLSHSVPAGHGFDGPHSMGAASQTPAVQTWSVAQSMIVVHSGDGSSSVPVRQPQTTVSARMEIVRVMRQREQQACRALARRSVLVVRPGASA